MMLKKFAVLLALVAFAGTAVAQDFGTLDPPHVPGTAEDGIPDLIYDPATGIVTLDTDGQAVSSIKFESPAIEAYLDGSPSGAAIFPTAEHPASPGFYLGPDGTARFWISTYFGANGTSQWALSTDSSNTGIIGRYEIGQYPTGLSAEFADFGYAEIGEFSSGSAQTWFTGVSQIPEPASAALLLTAVLGFVGLRRRR